MSLTCSTISLNIKATVTLLPSLRLGDYELNQWRQSIVQPGNHGVGSTDHFSVSE